MEFAENDLIAPQLRDSMGTIMAKHIVDVNQNLAAGHPVTPESFNVDDTHLRRFLADLGKDETAHRAIAQAENAYALTAYSHILSGAQHPGADLLHHLNAMEVVSSTYGSVLGTLDFGAGVEIRQSSATLDQQHNTGVENRYTYLWGPLAEQAADAAVSAVPGGAVANAAAGQVTNMAVDEVLTRLEESEKVDNQGRATYQVGAMLGAGRADAAAITEMALYHSGKLDLPDSLLGPDNKPLPVERWDVSQYQDWQRYKAGLGAGTVGKASTDMAESYQSGYGLAQAILGATNGGKK